MSDRWLSDCTLYGPASTVRERLEEWHSVGVTSVAVMSSVSGEGEEADNPVHTHSVLFPVWETGRHDR